MHPVQREQELSKDGKFEINNSRNIDIKDKSTRLNKTELNEFIQNILNRGNISINSLSEILGHKLVSYKASISRDYDFEKEYPFISQLFKPYHEKIKKKIEKEINFVKKNEKRKIQ